MFQKQIHAKMQKWEMYWSTAILGSNEFGQLGDGTEDSCAEPKRVKALDKEFVKSVACGANCTAAITGPRKVSQDDSPPTRLWVWGQNQVISFVATFFPLNRSCCVIGFVLLCWWRGSPCMTFLFNKSYTGIKLSSTVLWCIYSNPGMWNKDYFQAILVSLLLVSLSFIPQY